MIILHGLFGLGDNWNTISKVLATKGFCCYVVDQRNHGRSGHSMDFSYEIMAEDISVLMNDENLTTADFIGHSMGGKTAMFFAKAYPEKAGKMIVVDIAPRFYPPHHQSILSALKSFNPSELSGRKEAEEILRVSIKDESTIQFLLKNLYWIDDSKLDWRFGLDELDKNIEEVGKEFVAAEELNTDILFIRGDRSEYISDDDITSIKIIFPNAKFETIRDSGHWLHAEQPEKFVEICISFLNNK